jgi:type VI protein secretion system component VasK
VRVSRWQTWVTLAAALGIVLILTNMILFEWNRSLQREVDARAQYIQQTVQLEGLQREIVSAIANLSVRNKDDALKTILTQQGITINVNPQTKPAQAPEAKSRR